MGGCVMKVESRSDQFPDPVAVLSLRDARCESMERLTSFDRGDLLLSDATVHERSGFVTKIFAALAGQAGVAASTAVALSRLVGEAWLLPRLWLLPLSAAASAALVLGLALLGGAAPTAARRLPRLGRWALLLLVSALAGVALGLASALHRLPALLAAPCCAFASFAGLALFARLATSDLAGLLPYCFLSFCALAEVGGLLLLEACGSGELVPGACGASLGALIVLRNVQLIVVGGRGRVGEFSIGEPSLAVLTSCYFDATGLIRDFSLCARGDPGRPGGALAGGALAGGAGGPSAFDSGFLRDGSGFVGEGGRSFLPGFGDEPRGAFASGLDNGSGAGRGFERISGHVWKGPQIRTI